MNVIEIYQTAIEAKCKSLELENLKLKILEKDSSLLDSIINTLKENALSMAKNSPLSSMASDWLNQQISTLSTDFINSVTSEVENLAGNKISKFRNSAFKVITSAMCLEKNLIYFFAMQCANRISNQCQENIKELKKVKAEVQKLHNALATMNGYDDKYLNDYLNNLRKALIKLNDAGNNLKLLKSGYITSDFFNIENFNNSKKMIYEAENLITNKDKKNNDKVNSLVDKFKKGDLITEDIAYLLGASGQYAAIQLLWQIPNLTVNIVKTFNKHAVNLIKLNFLISTFSGLSSSESSHFLWYKNSIIEIISQALNIIEGLCKDMAFNLNGSSEEINEPIKGYSPNRYNISIKTPEWTLRIQFLKSIISAIDTNNIKEQNNTGELKKVYEKHKNDLIQIKLLKRGQAILVANEAKEIIADLETDILVLCAQATKSLFEKSITPNEKISRFQTKKSLHFKSRKILDRIDLSIELNEKIKKITESYSKETKKLLGKTSDIGESIISLCESSGLDRLKDILESADISSFLKMNESVSTYAGAALASLNTLTSLVGDRFSLGIIEKLKQEIQFENRSKELIEKTSFKNSATSQMSKNDLKVEALNENVNTLKSVSSNEGFSKTLGVFGPASSSISDSIYKPFSKSFGF